MGQWCARSIQTGPGSWCVRREAYPTARRSVQCWPRTDNGLRGGSRTNGTTPSLLWILGQAATHPNNTHQIKGSNRFSFEGRRDSRRIEQVRNQSRVITLSIRAPLIFISCGESTDQEKKLGKAV